MSGRKLNALEQKLHQSALADSKKTLTQKEVETLIPDGTARTQAINFLLSTGMFRMLKDAKGLLSFRAVAKKEMDVKKELAGEEGLVLSHIQAAANEGIWTKHLKAKTELHQTVIDRCLKLLVQKQLVKSVKSVKHPTRKLYMLFHLDPSVDITGGPWYTDNELDTEFIKLLSSACLRFIRDKSFPKSRSGTQPLYSISASPAYPTALQIQNFLSKSKITETQLNVEHVEMLLNVLITDGDIEKIPAFGAALWDAHASDDAPDSDDEQKTKKKRRRNFTKDGSRKRQDKSDQSDDSDGESDNDESRGRSKKRQSKKRRVKTESDLGEGEESGSDDQRERKKRRKEDNDNASDDYLSSRPNKRGKKTRRRSRSSSKSAASSAMEEDRRPRKKSRKLSSSSPTHEYNVTEVIDDDYGGVYVYRAIRQERVALGWSQAPCGRCPQFDFCSDKGPVNPRECEYYGEWLGAAAIKFE